MKKITINGVAFVPSAVTFNVLCDMEEAGAPMETWSKLDMGILRAYLSACLGITPAEAGDMIGEHVVKGGNVNELREAFAEGLEESDFFAALRNRKTANEDAE